MQRRSPDSISAMYSPGPKRLGLRTASDNAPDVVTEAGPEFIARAVAHGATETDAIRLCASILATKSDVRARRITPTGGVRRVERLALAVALAGGAS